MADSLSGLSAIHSPSALAAFLELSAGKAAALLGVHRNTLSAPISPRTRAKMQRVLIVLEGLRECAAGDDDLAAFWFRVRPIARLGHHTAEHLLCDMRRTPAEILSALEAWRG